MTEKNSSAPRPRGRPRKAPDELVSRQQLIRTGLICLTERGFSDVSLDEVLKASGVTKGSFYHHFKSKADYGMALIEAYDVYFAQTLSSWFSRDDLPPIERLRGFTISAEHGMAKYAFRRGCLIGNLGQEMASLPPELTEKLIAVLESWQAMTAACLREAHAAGDISATHDPDDLSAFFWIGWEGAVLRAKLERKPQPLRTFANGFFTLVTN